MSMKPQPIGEVPEETVEVARAAFPKGNIYHTLRDHMESMFTDEDFADLFAVCGQPAEGPWRLAWITVMQFMENLTDRQAAEAVRGRIDWKYLLGLPLRDPGFDFSVLCEFRRRLVEGEAVERLLTRLLDVCRESGWLKERGRQRTDSTHVLAKVRILNRLELAGTTIQHALNRIAQLAPEWLQTQVTTDWYVRYGRRIEQYRLPESKMEREKLIEQIGRDGVHLLTQIYFGEDVPEGVRELPEVETLRQIWLHQYYIEGEKVQFRHPKDMAPAAVRCPSPHDTDARYATKGTLHWTGYKVHLTETIDNDLPHLLVNVETVPGTEHDINSVSGIHEKLAERQILPREHLMDSTYADVDLRLESERSHAIEILSPAQDHHSWQKRTPDAFNAEVFTLNKDDVTMTCPAGVTSVPARSTQSNTGKPLLTFTFPRKACRNCELKPRCTRGRQRHVTIPPLEQWEVLSAARRYQHTDEFKERYRARAGIEGTVGQATGAFGLRRARYIGLKKTHLQTVATSVAINLCRIFNWLSEIPRAKTRIAPFAQLAPAS